MLGILWCCILHWGVKICASLFQRFPYVSVDVDVDSILHHFGCCRWNILLEVENWRRRECKTLKTIQPFSSQPFERDQDCNASSEGVP